jgi:hypothetical protein
MIFAQRNPACAFQGPVTGSVIQAIQCGQHSAKKTIDLIRYCFVGEYTVNCTMKTATKWKVMSYGN